MAVPFMDLGRLHTSIRGELDVAIEGVLAASSFVGGRDVSDFEEEFAAAHEATAAAGCGSGTDALALALRALGVGPGDEVIVPSMTFVATAEAVVHVGATPVIADVEPETLLLGAAGVSAVRSDRTRAVIPVHLYGHVVSFDDMRSWRDSGLIVVEDAAQAHLATWERNSVGSVGHAAAFSFYPGKNLGAFGDGGAVISADERLVAEIREIRDHGRSEKYRHDRIGWCSRLDGLQAAVLRVKLRHLPDWTEARRALAEEYAEHLAPGSLIPWSDGAVHHLLVMRSPRRELLRERATAQGISTGLHYPLTLSRQPSLAPWARQTPVAESAAETVLSLPMDPLMSSAEVRAVADVIRRAEEAPPQDG